VLNISDSLMGEIVLLGQILYFCRNIGIFITSDTPGVWPRVYQATGPRVYLKINYSDKFLNYKLELTLRILLKFAWLTFKWSRSGFESHERLLIVTEDSQMTLNHSKVRFLGYIKDNS